MTETERVTDKTLRAWLNTDPVDRGIGGGLTFMATAAGALKGQASWILRYRFGGAAREKVLGRYPDLSLKDAREATRQNRARIQQGVDVAAEKRAERLKAQEQTTVAALAHAWYDRHIAKTYKHPEVVLRVIRRHIEPAIGRLGVTEVRSLHIDKVLTRILDAGAPTVANDALRHLFRMFHFAVKRRWTDANPVSGFEISDAGGFEVSRQRWLNRDELAAFAQAMRDTPNFGRQNELAVWLLLALCVRKMELLSARWTEFDLERGVWSLHPSRTKMNQSIDIPLAAPVLRWLKEVQVFSCNSEYLRAPVSTTSLPAIERWLFQPLEDEHTGAPPVPVCFFGDLDHAGMQILASLREVFPQAGAWRPGYERLARLLAAGGGHPPELAAKAQQTDPGRTGCIYADNELLPLLRSRGRFIDQEAFDLHDVDGLGR